MLNFYHFLKTWLYDFLQQVWSISTIDKFLTTLANVHNSAKKCLFFMIMSTMAVKNFVFRENWVGSMVMSMKITLFVIFWPKLDSNVPKRLKYGILYKQYFNFQSIRKTSYIITNYKTLRLAKVKTLTKCALGYQPPPPQKHHPLFLAKAPPLKLPNCPQAPPALFRQSSPLYWFFVSPP